MAKRILTLIVLSLALFITPSWAASSSNCGSTMSLGTEALPVFSITCHFTPGPTGSATFDFGG